MNEPYETLLGQYRDHWLLWQFLQDDTPDWVGIANCGRLESLSMGELVMLHVAKAFHDPNDRSAAFGDILRWLDVDNRWRVLRALNATVPT